MIYLVWSNNINSFKIPSFISWLILLTIYTVHYPAFREEEKESLDRNTPIGSGKKHRDWWLAEKVISPEMVEWAVRTFEPLKAPGAYRIYLAFLQQGLGTLITYLDQILKACAALEYTP